MASNEVYLHKSMAPDEKLGRVDTDGRVYETRFGPDKYVGRVELENGDIFEARFGPDHRAGRVDLETGKIYLEKFGPNEYIGSVRPDGKLYYHIPLSSDPYLGKVTDMISVAYGGGAFLLLLLPALDQEILEVKDDDSSELDEPIEGE